MATEKEDRSDFAPAKPTQELPPPLSERAAVDSNDQSNDRPSALVFALWALAPALILAAASLLNTGAERQVLLPWSAVVIPETCAMHTRFGLDCPGCGLTRGFIHIAHGNPMEALRLNPISWFLFTYIASQIPLAIVHALHWQAAWIRRWTRFNEWTLIALVSALILQWLVRLAIGQL